MNLVKKNFQYVMVLLLFIFYILLDFIIPIQHDYSAYSRLWEQYLQTGHPYIDPTGFFNGNAYGPLFIFLAYFYKLHPLLPRILFVLMWFGAGLLILRENDKKENKWFIWLGYFLNPYFFIIFLVYGMNEAVCLFFLCFSLYYLSKHKQALSGFLLATGILFKFTPLFIVPFLFVGKKQLNWRFLFICTGALLLGYGVGYILWGKEVFEPFLFAAGRDSTFMSIFYILDKLSYWGSASLFLTLLALAVLFTIHLKLRLNIFAVSIAVLLTVLSLYKVSLPQYHALVIVLIFLLFSIKKTSFNKATLLYIGWISTVMVLYIFLNQFYGPMAWIRSFISIPTFLVSVGMVYTVFNNKDFRKN